MDRRRSRLFALGFTFVLVVLTILFGRTAYLALRPQESFRVEARAERTDARWNVDLTSDHDLYLYAFEESPEGSVRLLFPGPAETHPNPIAADRAWERSLPTLHPEGRLLLFAGLRPLWSLEEARHRAGRRDPDEPEPVLPLEAFLEVRGVPPVPAAEAADPRVSRLIPRLEPGPVDARGLWARTAS